MLKTVLKRVATGLKSNKNKLVLYYNISVKLKTLRKSLIFVMHPERFNLGRSAHTIYVFFISEFII